MRAVTSPAMSAYVVYEAVITDAEQYERYKALAAPSVAAAGGRYLARGGEVETFEGTTPARVVVLEFPTLEAAREWYRGEQYTAARALREAACDAADVRGRRHGLKPAPGGSRAARATLRLRSACRVGVRVAREGCRASVSRLGLHGDLALCSR